MSFPHSSFPRDPADAVAPESSEEEEAAAEAALGADLASLVKENEERLAQLQRLQADFENFRKQAQKRVLDEVDRATGKFVEELLPVLDACEGAFAHGVDGIEPIWSQLLGVLQRHGLEVMDVMGAAFDPTEQEAVMHEPGDSAAPEVVEVFRTGYRWKGKVLRAAMVKVKG